VETVGDLHGEAWIIASEISEKRGWPINFADEVDQQLIMSHLYVPKVIRLDRNLMYAVQIDQDYESENGPLRLIDRLVAPLSTDPLAQLLNREENRAREKALAESYSEASAYLRTFTRFRQDRKRICAYLCITDQTLSKRMVRASEIYHIQKSLFDRKEKIGGRFMPQAGRRYIDCIKTQLTSSQWGWDFGDQPGAGRIVTAVP